MSKTRKIIFAIALTLVLCTGASLLAQALFQAFVPSEKKKDVAVTITPPANTETDTIYIDVATEAELIVATKDPKYNAPDDYSDKAQRKVIMLTADITLTQDLLITRDCHIDLGGFTLDTNGYNITVYHTYTGVCYITSTNTETAHGALIGKQIGTEAGEGDEQQPIYNKLIVNTPNAVVLVDENKVTVTHFDSDVKATDSTQLCQAALSMVCAYLSNNLDHGIYGLLGTGTCTLPNYSEHFGCEHDACCFTVGAPDLPYWFFGYDDLKITYLVNPNANGESTAWGAGENTLKVNVSYKNGTPVSQNFNVHNISATDYTTLAQAATAVVMKDLEQYKTQKKDEAGNPVVDNNGQPVYVYEFKTAIRLPDTVSLGSVDVPMSYVATNGSVEHGLYSPADEDSLTIKCGPFADNNTYESSSITTSGSVSQLLDESLYTKANRVIKELFGSVIIVEKDGETYIPKTWESDVTKIPAAVKYGVTKITYSLSNNDRGFYDLPEPTKDANNKYTADWVLRVVSGNPEEYTLEKVFVQASVTITGSTDPIVFSIPIQCRIASSDGDVVSEFLPYYHYFNELFTQATDGNYTYHTFYMPAKYTDGYPLIEFCLVDVDNKANGGANKFYSFTTDTNAINTILGNGFISVGHPAILDANGDPVTDESGNTVYDETRWEFIIQPELIGYQDKEVVFGYRYQFSDDASAKDFEGKYSVLTVPGVVNQENNDTEGFADMPDDNLYAYIYSILYPGTSFTPLSDYILYSDVSKAIGKADESKAWDAGTSQNTANTVLNFEGRNNIASYEGLELLTGATGINLKNSGIDENELQYVAGMTSLEYLNLANNGLTDGEDFTVGDDIIAPLTALTKLQILHLENNTIYNFGSLSEFPALQEAYVYGNSPTIAYFENYYNTWLIGDLLKELDNTLTDIVQNIYGSTGSINIAEYSSICHRVDIYNTSATTPFSPELGGANDFSALSNLQYQDKIPADANEATIEAIRLELQTNLGAYGITSKKSSECPTLITQGDDVGELGDSKVHTNYIEFLYRKEGDNEYLILRYHDFVSIEEYREVDANGNAGDPITVAVEYYVDFKYPLTRLPAETATVDETNP